MTTFAELAEVGKQVQFKQGDLCHFELPVQDVARAKKFYGELFGWQFHDVPEMNYTLFLTPSGKLGGGLFSPEDGPAKVTNYLSVDSIEETAARLAEFGGQAAGPVIEIPGHGRMMHVIDSEGSLIALWQSPQ